MGFILFCRVFFCMFRFGPETIWVTHPDPDVRARFAGGLVGSKEYIPLLIRMLNDQDKRVRFTVVEIWDR